MGIQEQRSLVLLFHSRALLCHKNLKKEMMIAFLDHTFCFHIISTTIPCPKSVIETLEQAMQLS